VIVAGSVVARRSRFCEACLRRRPALLFSHHAAERAWSSTVGLPGKKLGQRLALATRRMTAKLGEKSFSGMSPPLLSGRMAYTTILAAEC
jgi:hypothetical protein